MVLLKVTSSQASLTSTHSTEVLHLNTFKVQTHLRGIRIVITGIKMGSDYRSLIILTDLTHVRRNLRFCLISNTLTNNNSASHAAGYGEQHATSHDRSCDPRGNNMEINQNCRCCCHLKNYCIFPDMMALVLNPKLKSFNPHGSESSRSFRLAHVTK